MGNSRFPIRPRFAAALAGEDDSCTITRDAIDFAGRTPYCANSSVGQDAFGRAFLALLLVLHGIGFRKAALGDCPVEENLRRQPRGSCWEGVSFN